MPREPNQIPKVAIRSIAMGLLLMALFTMMWSGVAEAGFKGADHYLTPIILSLFSLTFLVFGIYLFIISKNFRALSSEKDKAKSKSMRKRFGIIFGLEGVAIPVVCGILAAFHAEDYSIPAIALIVGLHFIPMAKLFDRKIDYYLAA